MFISNFEMLFFYIRHIQLFFLSFRDVHLLHMSYTKGNMQTEFKEKMVWIIWTIVILLYYCNTIVACNT